MRLQPCLRKPPADYAVIGGWPSGIAYIGIPASRRPQVSWAFGNCVRDRGAHGCSCAVRMCRAACTREYSGKPLDFPSKLPGGLIRYFPLGACRVPDGRMSGVFAMPAVSGCPA